jgi:hypothetical protein
VPYWIIMLITVALIVAFPSIANILPDLMM